MKMKWIAKAAVLFLLAGTIVSAAETETIAGFSDDEALKQGEGMYRQGILPSGEPLRAIVMGDIPVDGRMFTCDDCHQRSGLGSVEGTVITWPTNGKELYAPRRRTGAWRPPKDKAKREKGRKALPPYWQQVEDARPAYTDETLAQVLITGLDPTGRKLDPIMPRYLFAPDDMKIFIHYLKNLSMEPSPGVDEKTIRFATIITEEVPPNDRAAMLLTLQAHIEARNSQSRHQERRSMSGPFYKSEMHQAYRRLHLSVWELHGPEGTWKSQLQSYYKKDPVFGLLGGITTKSWKPIHDFCEQHKIPAVFPLTDHPVISETDWYTLYFSKGLYQEGEGAARYLHVSDDFEKDMRMVQVYRIDGRGADLAQGFDATWKKFGRAAPEHKAIDANEKLNESFWRELTMSETPTVYLLWLPPEDLLSLTGLSNNQKDRGMIFVSSSLLGDELAVIPDTIRDRVFMTYPYSLPGVREKRLLMVKSWLKARKIPVTNLEIQTKMYFLGWMLPGALKHMRSEFYREYFLEGFDMMIDQDYAVVSYPRLSFGPGQRYASKGCYIVQLSKGSKPTVIQKSDWVIH